MFLTIKLSVLKPGFICVPTSDEILNLDLVANLVSSLVTRQILWDIWCGVRRVVPILSPAVAAWFSEPTFHMLNILSAIYFQIWFPPVTPTALTVQEVHHTPDIRFVGSIDDNLVLVSEYFDTPKTIPVSDVLELLQFTSQHALSSAHINLVDSYALLGMDALPDPTDRSIPRNATEAKSPLFASEWAPAMDKEIQGFIRH